MSSTETGSSPQTVNLTTDGTTDWVQFGVSGSSNGFSLTNEKSGGSVGGLDTVGPVSMSGDSYSGGGVEATSSLGVSYTNGTSPTSSGATVGGSTAGIWAIQTKYSGNNSLPATGATLSFTIDFNQAISSGNIYVVGNDFSAASANFTAALSNGNTYSTTLGDTSGSNYNQDDTFDLGLNNITAGSNLTITWELGSTAGTYSPAYANVSLNAVALDLTEAPEPSTYAMMLGGAAILFGLVRFRCRTV